MSFKGSRKLPELNYIASKKLPREDSAPPMTLGEIEDPYWGSPVARLDDVPLPTRRPMETESSRDVEGIVSDLKLGALCKHHLKDWLVIILCIILDAVLNVIHPFYRFVGKVNIDQVHLPHKKNTVPLWAVPEIAIGIPLVVFIGFLLKKRNARDFHHAVLGLLTAVGVTAVFTDAIKDGVGRARPDFFWRCFPDGIEVYSGPYQEVSCTGIASTIREGHKSFPSGHSSWSFAGLGYLSFYLAGKVKLFDKRGYSSRVLFVLFPLLVAAMVAVSRVSDYWHHWQDVTVGGLLGLIIAYISYKQHFPGFADKLSGRPYPHNHRSNPLPITSRSTPGDWTASSQPPARTNGGGQYDLEAARM